MADGGIDLVDLLGRLSPAMEAVKENPELLSGALSLFGGSGVSDGERGKLPSPPPPPKRKESDRTRLLRALSPFLSPERQRLLSTLLALLEAWEAVQPLIGGLRLPVPERKE